MEKGEAWGEVRFSKASRKAKDFLFLILESQVKARL
jgi:hypothetical protein